MVHKYQNAVQVYLWAPLLSSAGSVVLETGKGGLLGSDFPLVGKITKYDTDGVTVLKREIVNITNRSGDIANITRAYETCPLGTASSALQQVAQDFDTNDILEIVVSKKCLDDFNTDIADLQTFRDTTVPATYATKTELANSQFVYGASSAGTDAYAITVANVSAYQNGQRFSFLADVGNTWPATFKVNALSALTIKKNNDQDLATWDIEAGQIVEVVINNTDGVAEMVSQVATVVDLSAYAQRTKQYTISGWVIAKDVVYPSANDTVKKLYPSDIQTLGASPTTSPTTNSPCKLIQIWNGVILQVSWSDGGLWGNSLKAQVRTINAAETDFAFWSEATLFASAVWFFDVCQIDTNTFIAIYTKNANGNTACVAFTISGTTITVWTEQAIEASNNTQWKVSIAKADTLKALICYQKLSDSKPYVQVVTVSGTTITTSTPVVLDNITNVLKTSAEQITTNQVILIYWDTSVWPIYTVTVNVSGTTPTVNTRATVVNYWNSTRIVEIKKVSLTKAVCVVETGNSFELAIRVITLSWTGNNTLSVWSATVITGCTISGGWHYIGLKVVWDYLIFSAYRTTPTDMYVRYYSIGATTVTLISTQTTATVTSASYPSVSIEKISPWTYLVTGMGANSDFIIKLTPNSSCRLWVAEWTIADGALWNIARRFQNAILSGLTFNTKYYADDDGQITSNASLTAPEVGYADSATNLILT